MFPVLIVAHANYENVLTRLNELKSLGFEDISVFVDGFSESGSELKSSSRKKLVEFILQEVDCSGIQRAHFNDINLGVGVAVPRAIDWFFDHVDFGLILEDDCGLVPQAKTFLNQCHQFALDNPNTVICLSNPNPNLVPACADSKMLFISSNYFSSWGWICHRKTWQRVSIREIELSEVLAAARRGSTISKVDHFWLIFSWVDIWVSLKSNQQRLWAFRFTVLLILAKVQVYYPASKVVQHSPVLGSTNVSFRPEWDQSQITNTVLSLPQNASTFFYESALDRYIVRNVHGASLRSLIVRFLFRLAKRVGLR
jgi:hypothetical protein